MLLGLSSGAFMVTTMQDPSVSDEAARNARLMKTGVVGTAIAALCCFTPLLAVLFGAVGLAAWLGYADYVLWPALALFLALTVYAAVRQRRLRHRGR